MVKRLNFIFVFFSLVMGVQVCRGGLLEDIGAVLSGQEPDVGKVVLERLQRGAGYQILRHALRDAELGGADYFVDALKYWIEENNGGKALGAFLKGCEASDVEAKGMVKFYYTIALSVRLTSPKISRELQSFIDYLTPRLTSYRGIAEMEKQKVLPEFSNPENTWNTFVNGLKQGEWEPILKSLIAWYPSDFDFASLENVESIEWFKDRLQQLKERYDETTFSIGRSKDVTDGLKALEIKASSKSGKETFWALFENRKGAWKFSGVIKDVSLLE